MAPSDLTASQLAELTGVPAGTLRVWENRYGFPFAKRSGSNRKRYSDRDVEQVRAVLEHRRAGLSLAVAIDRVRAGEPSRPASMFAALRDAKPDLPVRVYPKPLLLALSRAIEDEHAARAPGGVLLGSFQHERHYRASERRWRQLSRTAELTVAMADFATLKDDGAGPAEVPLTGAHPLEREWTVVVHSATASACLAAWEVPTPEPLPESERRFELVWSCDPGAAHAAVLAAGRVIAAAAPAVAARIPPAALAAPTSGLANQRFSDDLSSRAFAYLANAAAKTGASVIG